MLLLAACCLLDAQAPPQFPDTLIDRLQCYGLRLGDPNPNPNPQAIHIVKHLGPQYVLVEPVFVITPHNNNLIERLVLQGRFTNSEHILFGRYLLRASEIYDLQFLGTYFEHGMGVMLLGRCLCP